MGIGKMCSLFTNLEMSLCCTSQSTIVITLAVKRRRKGIVIILCVCVCVFAKFWETYKDWWLQRTTGRLQII